MDSINRTILEYLQKISETLAQVNQLIAITDYSIFKEHANTLLCIYEDILNYVMENRYGQRYVIRNDENENSDGFGNDESFSGQDDGSGQ